MIDDVDFLLENSQKDYVLIFVDSQKRDYKIFPTPSEYCISFDQPYKNVYSVEIVDAAIPTTMYNIDIYNRLFWVTTVKKPATSADNPITYINELRTSVFFSELFESPIQNYLMVCDQSHLGLYDVDNPAFNNDNTQFRIAVRYSIDNIEIVKRTNQSELDFFFFTYQDINYAIQNIPTNSPIINIINSKNYSMTQNNIGLYDIVHFEFKFIAEAVMNQIQTDKNYFMRINNYRVKMTLGNYDVMEFRFELNSIMNDNTNIFIEPVGLFDTRQAKFRYYSADLILFNCKIKELDFVLGFDLLPTTDDSALYTPVTIGNNNKIFMGNYNAVDKVYEITSPGMINLGGERYLVLRCPEIESHLYGSFAYNTNTPGIGMFKLAAGQNEITHLRWDFSTLIRKPTHPIGKLSKMTFRFEIPSGKLYDFKGVNHQFMIAIKFYIPSQKAKFQKSILNPNYNPNLIEYMASQKNVKNKESSDNEEDVDNDENYKFYKKQLDMYDYSTTDSEEEDDEDDSSEEVD